MSARLAILNITSFSGECSDAEHLYGNLILSNRDNVTIDNVSEWNVRYLGDNIELTREITLEEAKALDIKDQSYGLNQRIWVSGDKRTNRFNTFQEVVDSGIEKWKSLGLEGVCPFISLYEGERYYKNSYNKDETVIIE